MTQISLIVNSMPRDLTEFAFFLIVGFTAGSMGLIWKLNFFLKLIYQLNPEIIKIKFLVLTQLETLFFLYPQYPKVQ